MGVKAAEYPAAAMQVHERGPLAAGRAVDADRDAVRVVVFDRVDMGGRPEQVGGGGVVLTAPRRQVGDRGRLGQVRQVALNIRVQHGAIVTAQLAHAGWG
jgi:hypothetical protein